MRIWGAILIVAVGLFFYMQSRLEGKAAPDIQLSTVTGETVKLSNQKGKVVLLDFWATWCPPCRQSLPHLEQASENDAWAGKGLVVWAVNDGESGSAVSNFLQQSNFTFTALLDPDHTAASAYHVTGIPQTVIIGRDGTVRKVFVGYGDDSAREIDEELEKALAEPIN